MCACMHSVRRRRLPVRVKISGHWRARIIVQSPIEVLRLFAMAELKCRRARHHTCKHHHHLYLFAIN